MTTRYLRKETLHFTDGTIAEHTCKEVQHLSSPEHESPPVSRGVGAFLVPASSHYLQSWRDINPAIRNVTFFYTRCA